MRVALPQYQPVLGDKAANLKLMEKGIKKAKKGKVDLVVFSETFLTGYTNKDEQVRLAEPINGPSVKKVEGLASKNGIHIIFGMPELDTHRRGLMYNDSVLVTPKKEVNAYRKWHLPTFGPFEEKFYYTPGHDVEIFVTDLGRIGMLICYDLFFPELAKCYALKGADWLVVLSASPTTSQRFFEQLCIARAIENATPVIFSNYVGPERGMKFWGGSRIVNARGNIVVAAKELHEDFIIGDLDPEETEHARVHRPTIRDTRMELFKIASMIMKG